MNPIQTSKVVLQIKGNLTAEGFTNHLKTNEIIFGSVFTIHCYYNTVIRHVNKSSVTGEICINFK